MGKFARLGVVSALVGAGLTFVGASPAVAAGPEVRIGDVSVTEGDVGRAVVVVPVDLSTASSSTVTALYSIRAGTATARSDFLAKNAKVSFPAGITSKFISVTVYGDLGLESDETIEVALSAPVGATIVDGSGLVTVADDDADPEVGVQVSVGDVEVTEADGGVHTAAFAVTLSRVASGDVKVYWKVECGTTAVDGEDIVLRQSGKITFRAGQQSKRLAFQIPADQDVEEAVALLGTITVLSGPATVDDSTGAGVIIDDDGDGQTGGGEPPPPGNVERVSVDSDENEASYDDLEVCGGSAWGSNEGAVSDNGRYVAFVSDAGNLVPGDTNKRWDIFVRDLLEDTTERISVRNDGLEVPPATSGAPYVGSQHPFVSATGRYVTFASRFSLEVGDNFEGLASYVYLHDRETHTNELVSRNADGSPDGSVLGMAAPVSADGRYVTYVTSSDAAVIGDADPSERWFPDQGDGEFNLDVIRRDRWTGVNALVSVGYGGAPASGDWVDMTADGNVVAFTSSRGGLVPDDTNECPDVFVRDLTTGVTERVSVTSDGGQTASRSPDSALWCDSSAPAISDDGRYVGFESYAAELYPGLTGPLDYVGEHVYLRDRLAATTTLVSETSPVPGDRATGASISADGSVITYGCSCGTRRQVLATGESTLVGMLPDGTEPDAGVRAETRVALSGDGSVVVFSSFATNLLPDSNENLDVFAQSY